ncbi:response regulator transcription factor [Marinibactrum halimedae]|uniref:DNA-binding response regulator n=1 Tax=Marinibactrum halimedae TaxID=1444977 RepID=A0AA37WME0_9GAMM|nr:response regulator transcription factor [Marinibactrum halimedae]MCD9460157.1 response regulator transcription factor [Marinibactrum halimedae]GLS26373.1 DNA-binding response regulator [Marinibactrum halimedae]
MYHFHIADDHPLFRAALEQVISSRFPEATISQSYDLDKTLSALESDADIDLLLLDLHMPGSDDLYGLVNIRERFPGIPVVIVSAHEEQSMVNRAMGHGALGYITKSLNQNSMGSAIDALLAGDTWVPEKYRASLRPVSTEEKALAAKIASLTPQQYRVLCYLKEGWLNKQIGYELGVTEATIKAHITSIFRKLGVSNRTQAVIELNRIALHSENEAQKS